MNTNPYFPLKGFKAPVAFLILGVASIVLVVFTNNIHERLHLYFLYDDMIHEVQISLLKSHLVLEELFQKDPYANIEDVSTEMDIALNTVHAMLSGGSTYHGKTVPVLTETHLRKELAVIRPLIVELKMTAENRIKSEIEGSMDQDYDRIFADVINKTGKVIVSFEDLLHNYEIKLNRLFLGVMVTWTVILLIATLGMLFLTMRRNRAEHMLRGSEEHFRSVADTANDAVITVDSEGRIIYWNRAAGNIFGYVAGEVKGKPVTIIMSDDAVEEHNQRFFEAERIDKSRLTEKPIERTGVKKDGSEVPIEISLSKWRAGEDVFFTGIIRDITEHKEHEKLLRISRERYRSVVDAQTNLVCRWKGEGILTFVNDSFCRYFGMGRGELVGISFLSFMDHDTRERVKQNIDSLTRECPVVSHEHQILIHGTQRWLHWTTRAFFDESSPINEYQSVGQDITERRLAEEELKEHRERLSEMVEERTAELKESYEKLENEIEERRQAEEKARNMALFAELNPSPVLRFDSNGNVLIANPAASELLDMGVLTGRPLKSVIPGIERFDLGECIRKGQVLSHSAEIKKRYFHFLFKGIPYLNAGQIYGSDITDQKTAENETIRASQLASLGELAAGVAHEINNPINGIINLAQIIADDSHDGTREREIASQIIHEGDRIAGIVSSLLSFARQEQDEKAPVYTIDILSECLSLLSAQLKKEGITIEVNVPSGLPPIIAHSQKIEQVFLNIINNARYAVNEKYAGRHYDKVITIAGESVEIGDRLYVRTIFYDQGIGISDAMLDKVMNPFFSTKSKGAGTGLGLSISHGIISNHGGKFHIESSEGLYTKVVIDLPCKAKNQKRKGRTSGRPGSGMKVEKK